MVKRMTRLTEGDVRGLTAELELFERGLREVSGLTLRELAFRTVAADRPGPPPSLAHYPPIACVPVTTGEGVISGFSECVAAILRHAGWSARVTQRGDVRGLQEAVDGGAEVLFVADDHRFVALNVRKSRCVDDDPATADGYVTALEAAAGGLVERPVLLLGLGPVGRAAGRRLLACGARLLVVEPDEARLVQARDEGLALEAVDLTSGLERCDLVFDATPAPDLIDVAEVSERTIVAAPGIPPAFTAAARAALGARHIHEPLAVGVVVMAARALV
jgi:pyrrolysine biosynthesis protein PylD